MNFFIGLIITVLASLMVIKTDWLINNFGHSEWAEAKLGTFGGTRLLLKLIGLIFVFVGLLYLSGLQDNFWSWIAELFIPD